MNLVKVAKKAKETSTSKTDARKISNREHLYKTVPKLLTGLFQNL